MPRPSPRLATLALLLVTTGGDGAAAPADLLPDGRTVMQRVNARPRGGDATTTMLLELEDERRGRNSQKRLSVRRKGLGDGFRTRYRIEEPAHERGIELLIGEDPELPEMWMYFPRSDQRVRVATRGLSALATDFSCEDLKARFELDDFRFRTLGREGAGEREVLRVEMVPRDERLAQELGFDRAVGWVRTDLWLIVRADYYSGERPFKSFRVERVQRIDGVWTVMRSAMTGHRARHRTVLHVLDVAYRQELPLADFLPAAMARADGRVR